MLPDYDRAATLAAETLITQRINRLPVQPEKIIPTIPNTVLVPYADAARIMNISREDVLVMTDPAKDAVTYVLNLSNGQHYYAVAYNAKKPFDRLRFTLAHELGHILCGHIGVKEESVREAEADHFARHLLVPRAFSALLRRRGIPPIDTNFFNVAGCTPLMLQRLITDAHASHIDKHLNRKLREQFIDYLDYLLDNDYLVKEASENDHILPHTNHMEGYEE